MCPSLLQMTEYLMCPDLFPRYRKSFLHAPIWCFLNLDYLEWCIVFLISLAEILIIKDCLKCFLVSSGNTRHDVSWHWMLSFSLPYYTMVAYARVPPAYRSVYCRTYIMHYFCISVLSVVRSSFGSNFECSIFLAF